MEFSKYNSAKISDSQIKVALFMQELTDGFFANKGLQYLIDKAREIFNRPLMLYDLSFKVLASSIDSESIFQFEYGEDGNRYLLEDTSTLILSNHSPEDKKTVLYLSHNDSSPFQGMLIASVKIDVIEVAKLVIFEAGIEFQDFEYMLSDKFRVLLASQLQMSILLNLDNNQHPSYILADLIEGRMIDNAIPHSKKANLKWMKSDFLYILVICSSMQEAFDSKVSVVFQTLKSYIPVEQRIIYHSSIVAFIDEILYETLFHSPCSTFSKFIKDNNMYVGISRKFSVLSEAKKQYQYALDALQIGQQQYSHCTHFDDCILYIISDLITAKYDLMDFCHPAVIWLMNYDKENNSSLLATLKQYIYFTSAPAKAAHILNIHRNTLFYRIGKIKELTEIKLDNGDEKCQILMSIRLLESKGLLP